jgi:hypothetical protein
MRGRVERATMRGGDEGGDFSSPRRAGIGNMGRRPSASQLRLVGERELHQPVAAVNFQFGADVGSVSFNGAIADG